MFTATGRIVSYSMLLVIYLYFAYCLQAIARKQEMRRPWYAWIPILNNYLLCRICGKGVGWTILSLVPIIGQVFWIILFCKLGKACGRKWWYGLLFLVPIVNYVVVWKLAFGEEGRAVKPGRGVAEAE